MKIRPTAVMILVIAVLIGQIFLLSLSVPKYVPDDHPPAMATVIVDLHGELGNWLSLLVAGRNLQNRALQANPPIHTELIGQHENNSRWLRPKADIEKCFPQLRRINFEGGINDPDFLPIQSLQQGRLQQDEQRLLMNYTLLMSDDFRNLNLLIRKQHAGNYTESSESEKYRLPYVTVRQFMSWEMVTNLDVYNDARRWLSFDEATCCKETPYPDEVVFHFRNFNHELRRDGPDKYAEVSPTSLANFAFRDHLPGTRVAILSRFATGLEPYVEALESKNFSVRVIANQTGVEDFCFMKKTTRELVGFHLSTYFRWASFLSNTKVVRFYRLDQGPNRGISLAPVQRVFSWRQGGRNFVVEEYWQPFGLVT